MKSDYRLKYIDSKVAEMGGNIDDVNINNIDGFRNNNSIERFDGGINVNNSRVLFIIFATVIIILFILEDER